MKTKRQILKWIDAQPWANEFYKTVFTLRLNAKLIYNCRFITSAFSWTDSPQGLAVWAKRDKEFREWYDSNDKPMSWEEYCKQNPIIEGEYYIAANCAILDLKHETRDVNSDVK